MNTTLKEFQENVITDTLIAKFMGLEYAELTRKKGFFTKHNYRGDWNMLMEVVEKIENLEYYRFDFEIRQGTTKIYDKINFEDILEVEDFDKQTVVYYTVVEFIKWYNLNKKES